MNQQNTIWVILGLVVVVVVLMWFSGTFYPTAQPQAANYCIPSIEGGPDWCKTGGEQDPNTGKSGGTSGPYCPLIKIFCRPGTHQECTANGNTCVPDVPPECEQSSPSRSPGSGSDDGVVAFLSGKSAVAVKPNICSCQSIRRVYPVRSRTLGGDLISNSDYLAAATKVVSGRVGNRVPYVYGRRCKPLKKYTPPKYNYPTRYYR